MPFAKQWKLAKNDVLEGEEGIEDYEDVDKIYNEQNKNKAEVENEVENEIDNEVGEEDNDK